MGTGQRPPTEAGPTNINVRHLFREIMDPALPAPLTRHSSVGVWGLGSLPVLLANQARTTDNWAPVKHYYDLQVLTTNYDPGWNCYREFLETCVSEWFPDPIRTAAVFVDPGDYRQFVAGALYHTGSPGIQRVFNRARSVAEDPHRDSVALRRSEIDEYANREDIRVLAAFGILQYRPNNYVIDGPPLAAIRAGTELDRNTAAAALVVRLLDRTNVEITDSLIVQLMNALDLDPPPSIPTSAPSLPVYLYDNQLENLVDRLLSQGFAETLADIAEQCMDRVDSLSRSLDFSARQSDPEMSTDWPVPVPVAVVCAVASQRGVPVAADWIRDRENFETVFDVHSAFVDSGIDATLEERMLQFSTVYESPESDPDALSEYQEWLDKRRTTLQSRTITLESLGSALSHVPGRHRTELRAAAYDDVESVPADTTTFAYTMLDPEHLTESSQDEYAGKSGVLKEELRRIQEWRNDDPKDAKPFLSVLPEVVGYPLDNPNVTNTVRIMSPWFNFELERYVALFNRLLENDVTIKMLFRLPSRSKWQNFQEQFLETVGNVENISLRTYTRYKKYLSHEELADLSERRERSLKFGVHSKLFISGDKNDGKLLTGSANLMENSLHFNPETGLRSSHPSLVGTAISYFDLIWDLAKVDKISDAVMFGDVPYDFYPKVYQS